MSHSFIFMEFSILSRCWFVYRFNRLAGPGLLDKEKPQQDLAVSHVLRISLWKKLRLNSYSRLIDVWKNVLKFVL